MHKYSLLILISLLPYYNGMTQDKTWDKSTTKDQIMVQSLVSDTLIDGKEAQLIQYVASTTANVNYESVVKVFKEVGNFAHIFDYTERSEKVKEIKPNEYLVYFYLDMPWPMSDSDAAYKMKLTEQDNITQIEMISSPDLIALTEVTRGQVGYSIYHIEQLENNKVYIMAKTLSVPVSQSPDWMVNAWFPEGPANIIRHIKELSLQY